MKKILLMLLIPCFAHAANWQYISAAKDASVTFYFDKDSVKRTGTVRNFWLKQVYVPRQKLSAGYADSAALEMIANCSTRQMWGNGAVWYNGDNVVQSHQPDIPIEQQIAPGSHTETIWKVVCSATNPGL